MEQHYLNRVPKKLGGDCACAFLKDTVCIGVGKSLPSIAGCSTEPITICVRRFGKPCLLTVAACGAPPSESAILTIRHEPISLISQAPQHSYHGLGV